MSDEEAEAETEEAAEGEEDGEGGGKKKSGLKKLILFVVLPVVLLGGGGAGVFFSGILGGDEAEEAAEAAPPVGEMDPLEALDEERDVVFYDLPELLVNLNSPGRQSSFLKIQVSLELGSQEAVVEIEAVLPRIVDNFQVYLRELRPAELSGTKGVYRLKEELLIRVNTAVKPTRVYDILFKEILVQG